MAKKIALLLTLVMMFTISCVFATESDAVVTSEAPALTEDTSENVVESDLQELEEIPAEDFSTLIEDEEPLPVDDPTTSGEAIENVETSGEEHTHETEESKSAVVGAIIAVVIVVAIVAIVWILNKK